MIQDLLHAIPWRMPSPDLALHRGDKYHHPFVNVGFVRRPLQRLLETIRMAIGINHERLLAPLHEAAPGNFHSPFRTNSFETLSRALEVYEGDKKRILDMFFSGERIELPEGVRIKSVVLPSTLSRPIATPEPLLDMESEPPQESLPQEGWITREQKLLKQHNELMEDLRQSELGQEMIELMNSPDNLLELRRGERLSKQELSAVLAESLKSIAHILYTHTYDEDTIPPEILMAETPDDLLYSMIGDYRGRLQALHLKKVPAKSTGKNGRSKIALIVEKRSTGHRYPTFSGQYLTLAINPKVGESGVRSVLIKIDKEVLLRDSRAAKLVTETK